MTTEKKLEALKICSKITESLITDEKVSLKEIRKLESILTGSVTFEPAVQENTDTSRKLEKRILYYLKNLDIPSNIKGYAYIKYALMYLYRIGHQSYRNITVTRDLYPAVAREFETNATNVEHAIRHAIEVSWGYCNSEMKSRMFKNRLGSPTNSQFLYTIVDELLIESL